MNKPTKTKLFIDHANQMRECGNCHETKPFDSFSYSNIKHTVPRSTCKPCRSDANYRKAYEKKANLYPFRYWCCPDDNCNWIWVRAKSSLCPKCRTPGEEP